LSFEPVLLAPDEEPEEMHPFRRVWRTSWAEVTFLLVVVLAAYVLTDLLGILPADFGGRPLQVLLAVLPFGAWLLFSYVGERRALQPRRGLLRVAVLGALVANGIAIPLEEHVFTPELWLPTTGSLGQVLGYATTIGFTAEFLKFLIVRFTVWPQHFRQRVDGVAYSLAASAGYAVIFNLRFVLLTDATLGAAALRIASITLSQLGIGVIMGFFLAELIIGRTPIIWLSLGLGFGSLLHGLYYVFRGIAIVGNPGLASTGSSLIYGLAVAFGFVFVLFVSIAFIIENADARMEALTGQRQVL